MPATSDAPPVILMKSRREMAPPFFLAIIVMPPGKDELTTGKRIRPRTAGEMQKFCNAQISHYDRADRHPLAPAHRFKRTKYTTRSSLEGEDRGELRANILGLTRREALPQRQLACVPANCSRAVLRFFQPECNPGVQFVLQIRHDPVALVTCATRIEGANIASESIIQSVVQVHGPAGIASGRISIRPARQRQA